MNLTHTIKNKYVKLLTTISSLQDLDRRPHFQTGSSAHWSGPWRRRPRARASSVPARHAAPCSRPSATGASAAYCPCPRSARSTPRSSGSWAAAAGLFPGRIKRAGAVSFVFKLQRSTLASSCSCSWVFFIKKMSSNWVLLEMYYVGSWDYFARSP
jgi:hypothetical protein